MNKNGLGQSSRKQDGNNGVVSSPVSETMVEGGFDGEDINHDSPNKGKGDSQKYVTSGESLLRMEDHRKQTESLLQRFNNSHFFVRIAESNEPLWSKKRAPEAAPESSEAVEKFNIDGTQNSKTTKEKAAVSAIVDRGRFDSRITGGVARDTVKCCSLPNGDIVVCFRRLKTNFNPACILVYVQTNVHVLKMAQFSFLVAFSCLLEKFWYWLLFR